MDSERGRRALDHEAAQLLDHLTTSLSDDHMSSDTKIAIILLDDLLPWQALNVTAFLAGGIASLPDLVGQPYEDASARSYLPLIRQPVMIFEASKMQLTDAFRRAITTDLAISLYTRELFATKGDEANRAAVSAVPTDALDLVGFGFFGRKKSADVVTKGLKLHM